MSRFVPESHEIEEPICFDQTTRNIGSIQKHMIFEGQSANRSMTGFAGAFHGKGAATKAMMGMNPASTMPNYSMFGANAQNTYK